MDDKPDFLDMTPKEEDDVSPEPEPVIEPAPEPEPEQNVEIVPGKPTVTFRGNSYDLTAVVAVTIGGVVLLTCATCNIGLYCLPFVPVILGIVALIMAKDSVDPDRTKLLSWFSIGAGVVVILIAVLMFVAYFGFVFFMMGLDSMSYNGF